MENPTQPPRVLSGASLAALAAIGPADVVVGVHAFSQAQHVVEVLEAVALGLEKQFPGGRSAVLVADTGGAGDVLRPWSQAADSGPVRQCLELTALGHRGRAILGLLVGARELRAEGCALVDADLVAFPPDWVGALLGPIARGEAEYVSPAYSRAVSEGTLTTNLLAPFSRAVYGKRVQQPAGGCAAISGRFVARCLESGAGDERWAPSGIEIWLTTEALVSGAAIVEVHLGGRPGQASSTQVDLATTLAQTVGPLFALAERYHAIWEDIRGSVALPRQGDAPTASAGSEMPPGDRMVRAFKLGLKDLLPVWEQIMPEATLDRLYPLGLLPPDEFRFPPALWAKVVSDFAVAYHERRLPQDHLLRALTPLYLGRVAAFLLEATPPGLAPDVIETIGQAFEAEKESLVARWR